MHRLRILYTLKSHVLIDSGLGDENMMVTREYLPGTTLIGAYATRFISMRGLDKSGVHQDSDFRRFFLGHDLRFLNAYFAFRDSKNDWQRSAPIPACLFETKKEAPKSYAPRTLYNRINTGPEPGEAGAKGWCSLNGNRGVRISLKKRIHFHHQQEEDRFTGRSTGGMIFNYDTLFPGQSFMGEIRGTAEALKVFFSMFQDIAELPIGRSKMTEYGNVTVQFLDKEPQPLPQPAIKGKGIPLIGTCLSPVILYNQNGFPDPSVRGLKMELAERLGIATNGVDISQFFSGVDHVENYVGIWNLRKFTDRALSAGSVFKMNLPKSVSDRDLHALQCLGIGLRRSEGFGEICLDFPTEKTYTVIPYADQEKIPIPQGNNIPQAIKSLVTDTVREHIRELIRLKAQDDSLQFSLDSTAILGRLEGILGRGAGSYAENIKIAFINQNGQTDKKAAKTLKFCYTPGTNRTLWEHLMSHPELSEFIWKNCGEDQEGQGAAKGLHGLMKDPLYRNLNIKSIITSLNTDEKLLADYWLTFIRSLRKHSKEV